jgi:hypothetical protein
MTGMPFATADAASIPADVARWLSTPAVQLYDGWPDDDDHRPADTTSLGDWLVSTVRDVAGLDDEQLVFQTVLLAVSTSFGLGCTFPFDGYDDRSVQLYTFPVGDEDDLNWSDSDTAGGRLELAAGWEDEDGEHRYEIPPVALALTAIGERADAGDLDAAKAALSAGVTRVLRHLHTHRGVLPQAVAAGQ